jgi:hypothetical protein
MAYCLGYIRASYNFANSNYMALRGENVILSTIYGPKFWGKGVGEDHHILLMPIV